MISFNKRGQLSSTETGGWFLTLLVLVVVALVVWGIFSYLGQTTELAPDQLTVAATYCENSPLKAETYCNDYKEFKVSGKTYYYNCYQIGNMLSPVPDWAKSSEQCSGSKYADLYVRSCLTAKNTGKLELGSSVYFDEKECKYNQTGIYYDGEQLDLQVESSGASSGSLLSSGDDCTAPAECNSGSCLPTGKCA